jgi:transcription elongation factor SPT5
LELAGISSQQTVGVIFKTERVSLRVLDQNGIVRQVQPHQITMRRDSNRAVATDAEGQPIRIQDTLKEVAGEVSFRLSMVFPCKFSAAIRLQRKRGTVLHIYQSQVAFLHNREISENNGVFVVRCRNLTSLNPKSSLAAPARPFGDPGSTANNGNGGGFGGKGAPRDRLVNIQVLVVKGPYKGLMGSIKDTNGHMARVELSTNKTIPIDKAKLRRKEWVIVALTRLSLTYLEMWTFLATRVNWSSWKEIVFSIWVHHEANSAEAAGVVGPNIPEASTIHRFLVVLQIHT